MTMSQRAKGKKKRDILVNAELIYKVMGNHHIASSYMCSLSAFVSPCNSFLDDGNVCTRRVRARAGLRDGGSLVDEGGVVKLGAVEDDGAGTNGVGSLTGR